MNLWQHKNVTSKSKPITPKKQGRYQKCQKSSWLWKWWKWNYSLTIHKIKTRFSSLFCIISEKLWFNNDLIWHHYRIHFNATPGFYFSIWVFWWELFQKIPQKVRVYSRKPTKTGLFTLPGALFESGAALTRIRYSTCQSFSK